jgi:hypothetical protein
MSARSTWCITWSTQRLIPCSWKRARDFAVLKIALQAATCSSIDDEADADLFNSVFGWTDSSFRTRVP